MRRREDVNTSSFGRVYYIKGSSMSSPDSIKKRRIATTGNSGGGGGNDNGIVDDGSTTMSKILAKMNDMQNEMNGMKSELDSCKSSRDAMQKEMNTMKNRLSHIDELEKKCDTLETKCNVLEKKCIHLDTRCDSLQRSVQILSKESKWEYSVPPIPDSHWRGFDEYYIEQIQNFLSDIKRKTCELRSGKELGGSIYLGFADDEDPLQHDDILLPRWKEFANALQLYQYKEDIPELSINNIQLSSQVLHILAPALEGKPLIGFVFDNNDFEEDKGIEFATECINSNNKLQHFDWVNNHIDNTKDAMSLVDAIVNHPSITKVRLENCLGGDMNSYEVVRPLFAIGNKNWIRIDIESNNIQTKGDTAIPNYIACNPPLEYLFLSGNKLNDDDAILFANALKQNNHLKYIHLNDNSITGIGKEALSKAVYDPTSLNSMSDCNHKCSIYIDGGINVPIGCGNDSKKLSSSILKRGAKIYQLLSQRNKEGINVKHLKSEFDGEDEEDDSLKLVPKVLECVHKYHDCALTSEGFICPLSIIYEIIRGWKMPELYEKQS